MRTQRTLAERIVVFDEKCAAFTIQLINHESRRHFWTATRRRANEQTNQNMNERIAKRDDIVKKKKSTTTSPYVHITQNDQTIPRASFSLASRMSFFRIPAPKEDCLNTTFEKRWKEDNQPATPTRFQRSRCKCQNQPSNTTDSGYRINREDS